MEKWLIQRWYGASAPALLQPFSWFYGAAINLRRWAYARGLLRRYRVERPVLVVGNLTVGGTGKTPLVAWIAQELTRHGFKIGIVSRGYGGTRTKPRIVERDSDWRVVGDEPLLLKRATGCLTVVAADRVAGARMLIERGVDAVVADDGLQHLRLARDCEIVVIDGVRGFGNGHLLPAGPLREPVSRLANVDLVVLNGAPEHASLLNRNLWLQMRLLPGSALPVSSAALPRRLEHFRGQPVHAVAGIGNPQRFFRDLRVHGLEPIEHPFPDHYAFTAADLEFNDELPVLMTEKDALKCRAFTNSRLWYVPVAAQFADVHARELLKLVVRNLGLAKG